MVRCPRCKAAVPDDVPVCPACNAIVDELSLQGVLDDADELGLPEPWTPPAAVARAPAQPAPVQPAPAPQPPGDPARGHSDDDPYLANKTGAIDISEQDVLRAGFTPTPFGHTASHGEMMRSDSVLEVKNAAHVASLGLSPFEAHVVALIDGVRPVARLRKKSGLSSDDLRIALGMLCDRHILRMVGRVAKPAAPDPEFDEWDVKTDAGAAPLEVVEGIEDIEIVAGEEISPATLAELAALDLRPVAAAGPRPVSMAIRIVPGQAPVPAGMPAAATMPAPVAMRPPPPVSTVGTGTDRAEAASLYALALQDAKEGRAERGLTFAKLAAQKDPGERRYAELVRGWARVAAAPDDETPR